ncbi:MAG: ethanolamine permease [Deltaproteobacteria bacterium]|nr:ethanolamine permease [Deltaproteobacteria bacterium]
MTQPGSGLRRTLGGLHVWGLAVGLVISGEYFGWSYGWGVAGPLGFLVATLLVAVLYVGLSLCLAELATAIPDAGGPFAYGLRALGPWGGYLAAVAALVEFLLAPPAIAYGLGSYLHVLAPSVHAGGAAAGALVLFGVVNLAESKQSARFETAVTVVALVELLVFIAVVAPAFRWERFTADGWMGGTPGVFAALPFAIWFFLGIEGAACAVEETREPEKNLPRGLLLGILTLVLLALGVMAGAGGAGDWKRLNAIDFPIPEAVSMALGAGNPWVKGLAGLGLFGLVASLNGILFGAARQLYAVARAGLLPRGLAAVNGRGVPARAVVLAVGAGLCGVASGKTADLITLSALGALAVYALTAASLLRLRHAEPGMVRPFRAPLYPAVPVATLGLSLACGAAIAASNPGVFRLFAALVLAAAAYRWWVLRMPGRRP